MPVKVEARYARSFVRGWTIFLLAWTGVGAALFAIGMVTDLWPLRIPGSVLVAVFLPMFFYARIRLTHPSPVIVIDPAGYFDRRLGTPVPWTAITELRRVTSGSRIFLTIDVPEPGRYLERTGPVAFLMRRLNPKMGFPVLGSNLSGLDTPQESIAAAAEAWWAAGGKGPARAA